MTQEDINAVRIAELEKRVGIYIECQREAVEKASNELRGRLASMNEFRDQLRDQAATLLPRAEHTLHYQTLVDRITALESNAANTAGRFWAIGLVASVAGGVIGIIGALLLRIFGIGVG